MSILIVSGHRFSFPSNAYRKFWFSFALVPVAKMHVWSVTLIVFYAVKSNEEIEFMTFSIWASESKSIEIMFF